MNTLLWILAFALAAVFLVSGGVKLVSPREQQIERTPYVEDFPQNMIRGIGALEILGAMGLLIPALTGSRHGPGADGRRGPGDHDGLRRARACAARRRPPGRAALDRAGDLLRGAVLVPVRALPAVSRAGRRARIARGGADPVQARGRDEVEHRTVLAAEAQVAHLLGDRQVQQPLPGRREHLHP